MSRSTTIRPMHVLSARSLRGSAVVALAVASVCAKATSAQTDAPQPLEVIASQPTDERTRNADTPPWWGYVVGLSLAYAPPYSGAGFSSVKLRPLVAVKLGRWRLSSSRAGSVMGFGTDNGGSGASTDLFEGQRWKFGLSARVESGRRSSESPRLTGLPDIERTVRARLYANYLFTPRLNYLSSASQDILGRGGGLVVRQGFGYSVPFKWADMPSEWSVGVGMSWANQRQLATRYGITPEQSQATGLPAFKPDAGWYERSMGVGFTTAVNPRWVLFGNYGWSTLTGAAAKSPLTLGRSASQLGVGLAYRCCQ